MPVPKFRDLVLYTDPKTGRTVPAMVTSPIQGNTVSLVVFNRLNRATDWLDGVDLDPAGSPGTWRWDEVTAPIVPPVDPPVTPPDAPTIPTAAAISSAVRAINVTWSPPASDGGSAVTGFVLLLNNGTADLPPVTVGAGATSYSLSAADGVADATTYTVKVGAFNVVGTGPYLTSNSATTPGLPGAPTALTTIPGDASVQVSWTPPASNGGASLTSYVLRAYLSGVEVASKTGAWVTTATLTGLTNDTDYTFKVEAVNGVGTGPQSSASGVAQPNYPIQRLYLLGRWNKFRNGNTLHLVASKEPGWSSGLCFTHELVSGTTTESGHQRNELIIDTSQEKPVEGDVVSFYLPVMFPAAVWSSSFAETVLCNFLRIVNSDWTQECIKLQATTTTVRVMGSDPTTPLATTTGIVTDHKYNFQLNVKFSNDPAVGWIEFYKDGVQVLARTPQRTMVDASCVLRMGADHPVAQTTTRGVRHGGVEYDLTRNGVTKRIRCDPHADAVHSGLSNDTSYTNIKATNCMDRIQVVSEDNWLAYKFTAKAGDLYSNGQRAEVAMIDRTAFLRQLREGDKAVIQWSTRITDSTTFPFLASTVWAVMSQFHQLSETYSIYPTESPSNLGSPPQQWTLHDSRYRFALNVNHYYPKDDPMVRSIAGTPDNSSFWYNWKLTMVASQNPAKGYVIVECNGDVILGKTFIQTIPNYPPSPDNVLGSGEVLGNGAGQLPESLYWKLGLYELKSSAGGDAGQRTVFHRTATVDIYMRPGRQSAT